MELILGLEITEKRIGELTNYIEKYNDDIKHISKYFYFNRLFNGFIWQYFIEFNNKNTYLIFKLTFTGNN